MTTADQHSIQISSEIFATSFQEELFRENISEGRERDFRFPWEFLGPMKQQQQLIPAHWQTNTQIDLVPV